MSVAGAGVFYFLWLAGFLLVGTSGGPILKTIGWMSAPVATAVGFAVGAALGGYLTGGRGRSRGLFVWPLVGCAFGAGFVVWFERPMLIVFGMFALGTAAIALREILQTATGEIDPRDATRQRTSQGPAGCKARRTWLRRLVGGLLACLLLLAAGLAGLKVWQLLIPSDAPLIGVSLDTAWHARSGITIKSYEIALTRAGGRIVRLWPGEEDPDKILDRIDALLLAGGGDIDPQLYGGRPETAALVDRRRDDFELALIRGALKRDMPVLGICRGIQILNVSQGGTLRDLRDQPQLAEVHGITLGSMDAHPVSIAAESRLADVLGEGQRRVSSFHGQAVDRLGNGLIAAATAPDGVVEAVELPGQSFAIAVQWHPELPPVQTAVFEAFLEEARGYRRR